MRQGRIMRKNGKYPEDKLRDMRPFEPSVAVILLSNVDRCI